VADRHFLDSNIVLYAVDDEDGRTTIARELIFRDGATISTQVLNEFINIAVKKFKLSKFEIATALTLLKSRCSVVPLTLETHERAWELFCTTNLGVYDANIVAAAELAGCNVLYTEDLSHGQVIGRVTIRNPFMAP
jgi:predicted nucleic acid-binding protein